jgi:PAS domain S-box-containing protein
VKPGPRGPSDDASVESRGELERLRTAERLLTSITRHAPDYILHFDRQGVISYMNRPPPGYRMEEVIGSNVRKWMLPEYHEAFAAALERVYETAALSSYESVGAVTGRYYVNRISPVLDEGGVASAVLITHDVTELKRAEQQRAEAEDRYRVMVEASFEGLCISVAGDIKHANRAAEAMFGYGPEGLVGIHASQITTPESAAVVLRNIAAGYEAPYEVMGVRKDGSTFPFEALGRNVRYDGESARITGMRDLTEAHREQAAQTRREARVQHAQKLETLGVLAGGIAHDFNNLLSVVVSNAELALRALDDKARVKRCLEQVVEAAQRGGGFTHQLLVYAGKGDPHTELVDLGAFLSDLGNLLRVSVPNNATLRYELCPELPAVEVDPVQLQQVAMNLIMNASEALHDGVGEVVIRTTGVDLTDDDEVGKELELPAGRYAAVEVSDTGVGMDAAARARIFDPFYTTKSAGRGLGLAAALGIVRSHRGGIEVESTPGVGTRIRVLLPAATDATPKAVEAHEKVAGTQATTVLVAEDEPPLARVLLVALETAGHRVISAADGREALELFRAHADDISVALLDVTMPGMDGFALLAELRKIAPDLPVVLSSGHSTHGRDPRITEQRNVLFLAKPYQLNELAAAVQSALDARKRSRPGEPKG